MTLRSTIHLVCNSHIDPVWLWEWEEGVAEALSTFRAAAELCEEFDGFVFNHNEAVLYRWVEEYEPELFERIQRLVREGRWHIMGGWHLQPDCNMPSGESFVRQIQLGKRYFKDRFGVEPTTAINFDPFGHSRGLVQILRRSGYDSYIYCRPSQVDSGIPAPEFTWVGFDGSEIRATLAEAHYNSDPGRARAKLDAWIEERGEEPVSLLLWGVGNHGGGPSREDLRQLARAIGRKRGPSVVHSTPEAFVEEHRRACPELPRHEGDLNPWAVGCYTSMHQVKEKHRRLENELFTAEKMSTAAFVQGLIGDPRVELAEAERDLVWSEFHDSLPGSSIEAVEGGILRALGHGLEITSRVKARSFFALAAGQRQARQGEFPVLVYNPHPFEVETIVEVELQPAWLHRTKSFTTPVLRRGRAVVSVQPEKERCNIDVDHRKRLAFPAKLAPGKMNRFDCVLERVAKKPAHRLRARSGKIRFRGEDLSALINARTGLIDRLRIRGNDCLRPGAFRSLVMRDDADPWGMRVDSFPHRVGAFRLLSRQAAAHLSPTPGPALASVRVIEDGPVRSVVEALFGFGDSFLCQRYKLPKRGTELELELRVLWNEKDRMLKLAIPTLIEKPHFVGQTAYGVADLPEDGKEAVSQQWQALVSGEHDAAVTVIDDGIHGSSLVRSELRLSLLRAPAHAGHPMGPECGIVPPDRFTPRIDQGEHLFRFWLNAGAIDERLSRIDREALVRNAPPMALCFSPPGSGELPKAGVTLSDGVVQLSVFKLAESGDDLILRLFEPTGCRRTTTVALPFAGVKERVTLEAFEVKTLRFEPRAKRFVECDLLEEPIVG